MILLVGATMVAAAGCGTAGWYRPGNVREMETRDWDECRQGAIVDRCMRLRGYQRAGDVVPGADAGLVRAAEKCRTTVGPAPRHQLEEPFLSFKTRVDGWRERYERCVGETAP